VYTSPLPFPTYLILTFHSLALLTLLTSYFKFGNLNFAFKLIMFLYSESNCVNEMT